MPVTHQELIAVFRHKADEGTRSRVAAALEAQEPLVMAFLAALKSASDVRPCSDLTAFIADDSWLPEPEPVPQPLGPAAQEAATDIVSSESSQAAAAQEPTIGTRRIPAWLPATLFPLSVCLQ